MQLKAMRTENEHRRMGRRGGGGCAVIPKLGKLRFFGQEEKFGQSQFLKKFACVRARCNFFFFFFFRREMFSVLNCCCCFVRRELFSILN